MATRRQLSSHSLNTPPKFALLRFSAAASLVLFRAQAVLASDTTYTEMCDASAIVPLNSTTFVAADDEHNVLRTFVLGRPEPGKDPLDLNEYLNTGKNRKEVDIEGAAQIGDKIWWITSHGRNSDAEEKPNRKRLFFTLVGNDGTLSLDTGTVAYRELLPALQAAALPSDLKERLKKGEMLAAEAPDGLSIEGMAATPDGGLLIGFRNPLSDEQAIVVPLKNPNALSNGKEAEFGDPIFLKLGKRGIRDLLYVQSLKSYLVVAGPTAKETSFALYRWAGPETTKVTLLQKTDLTGISPEAIAVFPDHPGKALLLSDDGDVSGANGQACKDQEDVGKQSFRARWIDIPIK